MRKNTMAFRHPLAFWIGCAVVAAGVGLHMPMFIKAAPMHFHMAGMAMDDEMLFGMALIALGMLLAAWGLLPRLQRRCGAERSAGRQWRVADDVPLNGEHWKLAAVLSAALTIDVMKPASIAFVMPGMVNEYGIDMDTAGYIALSALAGTAVGSVLWGCLGDLFGRRAAILLSAILFMGTAICGTMPSFAWNLAMCFMMGAAAGGMLPIAFTLMAETVPARHRGWLLVALGGIGTTAGFFAASVAATLLIPHFSWRVLWLLNLPTGAAIVLLNRYIPESPRFLVGIGRPEQAQAELARFAGKGADTLPVDCDPVVDCPSSHAGFHDMLRGNRAAITAALLTCGLAWGVVNFGFVLWLPANLQKLGLDAQAASSLMARSALLAIPGIAVVVWLYQRWSSFRTLVLFVGLMALSLAAFAIVELAGIHAEAMTIAATVLLLSAISGVIATMVPYAAEVYPMHLRGTGSGVIAAGAKAGGIAGAALGVIGLFDSFVLSAVAVTIPILVSGVLLWRGGIETRGRELEAIEQQLQGGL